MPLKIEINEEDCIGCGACVSVNDKIFELVEGVSKVKMLKVEGEDLEADAQEAADVCPVDVLKIIKE